MVHTYPLEPDIEITRVPGFWHKFVGLNFTLEAKNNVCEISA
jgi:hypothetical protein